jgi:hypothetical protein
MDRITVAAADPQNRTRDFCSGSPTEVRCNVPHVCFYPHFGQAVEATRGQSWAKCDMRVEVFLQRTLNIEPPFQCSKIPAVIALVQATVGDEMQFGCP